MDGDKTSRLLLIFQILAAAVTFLTEFPRLVESFRSNPTETSVGLWALVIIGVIALWGFSAYRGFSSRYNAVWGKWLSIVITVMILILVVISEARSVIPPSKIVVLVANFEGAEPDKHQITNELVSELRQTLRSYPNVEVRELRRAITEADGSAEARAVGKTEKASIVLWGWYRSATSPSELRLHIEVLTQSGYRRDPDKVRAFKQTITIEEWETATVNSVFPQGIGFLYPMIDGLTQYLDGNWGIARDRLSSAWQAADTPSTFNQLRQISDLIRFYQGLACEQLGWPDCTIETCTTLLTRAWTPRIKAFVYNNLGNAAMENQDLAMALDAYNNAIQADEQQGTAYANRAVVQHILGDDVAARADSAKAVELGTYDDTVLYIDVGNLYASANDWNQAVEQYDKAVWQGRYGSTRPLSVLPKWIYRVASGVENGSLEALYYRGIAYRELGQIGRARQDLTDALDMTNDPTRKQHIQKELDAVAPATP